MGLATLAYCDDISLRGNQYGFLCKAALMAENTESAKQFVMLRCKPFNKR